MQNSINHHLSVTAIVMHPFYHSAAHINPIETLVDAIKVRGHHTGQTLQNERIGHPICWQIPQVVAVAEDQVRWNVAVLTAAAPIRLSEETWSTLAHVGTNCVFTQLTAHAGGLCTLVDIVARFAVRHEAVARTTGAYKASRCVGAIVIAVVNGWVCALIDTYS